MSLGRLVVELALDSDNFDINIRRAKAQMAGLSGDTEKLDRRIQSAEASTRSWGRTLRDSVITLALIRSAIQNVSGIAFGWQRAIIGVNAEIQRSIALMKTFSGGADELARTQEAVADVQMLMQKAASAPFDFDAITDAYVKLRVAGIEDTRRSMDVLVDSIAAFGGTSENLKRAGVAIQQMAGKGVVSMEELRQQLGESVPSAIQAMADGLNTSYDELVKQISLGRVKAGPAIKAMMDELERQFAGRAETMMNTVTGSVAQFQTSLKMLAASFGGLTDDGYAEGGFMSTITNELQAITDLLNSPEMMESARQLGDQMAELVRIAAEGARWIIENRDAIVDWGKAIATVIVIMKGMSIATSLVSSIGGATRVIRGLADGMVNARLAANQFRGAMESQSQAVARQTAKAAAGAQVMTRWGLAAAGARTALSVLGGPVGILTGLAISGGMAWYNYRNEVNATREAVMDLKNEINTQQELEALDRVINEYSSKLNAARYTLTNAQRGGIYRDSFLSHLFGRDSDSLIQQSTEEMSQINSVLVGLVDKRYAYVTEAAEAASQRYVTRAERAIRNEHSRITAAYKVEHDKLLKQRQANEITEEQYHEQRREAARASGEAALKFLEERLGEFQQQYQELDQTVAKAGKMVSLDTLAQMEAVKSVMESLSIRIADQREALMENQRSLDDVLIGGGKGKVEFNPLLQYFQNLSVAVAKAGAKAEEENPHLAQLYQIVENMKIQDQNVDSALVARIEHLAAVRWEQEKATKALAEATKVYTDSMDRASQIERLAGARLNKAENENPWLNASADAKRYREELDQMTEALQKAREKALELNDVRLVEQIDATAGRFAQINKVLDDVSVADATKRIREEIRSINDSLMTETERAEAAYQRQIAWAKEYYQTYRDEIAKSAEARAAYNEYLASLEAQYLRQTESGLQAWIRDNKDATDAFKSLWKQSMDSFVDTVTDGLIEGRMQFKDFTEAILREIMRIMIAKSIAGIAETALGAFNFGGSAGGSTTGAAGASGGGSSSFFQLGGQYQSSLFADGGIMTKWGKAKLKQYANGGIARSPQVAIFGEGSTPEAYVPLPDGRTIPVTLQGELSASKSADQPQAPVVNVNVINQSSQDVNAEQQGARFDGEQFVVDVVLKNISRPGPIRDAVRNVQ